MNKLEAVTRLCLNFSLDVEANLICNNRSRWCYEKEKRNEEEEEEEEEKEEEDGSCIECKILQRNVKTQ